MKRWEDELPLDTLRRGVEPVRAAEPYRALAPDLADCIAGRLPRSRHLLVLWEPIATKAPSPARCQPYCCYLDTVIFYARPYISRPGRPWRGRDGTLHLSSGSVLVEYDQARTKLRFDDVVAFDGDEWTIGGGYVRWHGGRWWMRHWARRR